jgi:DNA polymerase-4
MAVELAKPKPGTGATGVRCVEPGTEATFLGPFRLADLPMVGPRFSATLARMGLDTIAEAQRWSETDLQARLGARAGAWLYRRVRGIDDSIVTPREVQKQVSREETFGRDLHDDDQLERELLRLAVRVSTDLRRQGLRARTVTVKLKDADFTTRSAQRTLAQPIESEKSVIKAARGLYRTLRGKRRVGVRLLGIGLSHFDDDAAGTGHAVQLGFFAPPPLPADGDPVENAKDRALTRALDQIRGRYGSAAIIPARLLDQATDTGPRVEE